ncbi:DUF5708 family protein [Actinoplanes campanulatus]|uniref:DUF5708 family protein n=1 Tax=Actinoplanes campanulatus TaxID=113559 RepID=UPI0035712687
MRVFGKSLLAGAGMLAAALVLWLFMRDVHIPILTLPKVGIVLMVIGGLEICHAVYLRVRRNASRNR